MWTPKKELNSSGLDSDNDKSDLNGSESDKIEISGEEFRDFIAFKNCIKSKFSRPLRNIDSGLNTIAIQASQIINNARKRDVKAESKDIDKAIKPKLSLIADKFPRVIKKIKWKIWWKPMDLARHLMWAICLQVFWNKCIVQYLKEHGRWAYWDHQITSDTLVINDAIIDILQLYEKDKSLDNINKKKLGQLAWTIHQEEKVIYWETWEREICIRWVIDKMHCNHSLIDLKRKVRSITEKMKLRSHELNQLSYYSNLSIQLMKEIDEFTCSGFKKSLESISEFGWKMYWEFNSNLWNISNFNNIISETSKMQNSTVNLPNKDISEDLQLGRISMKEAIDVVHSYNNPLNNLMDFTVSKLNIKLIECFKKFEFEMKKNVSIEIDQLRSQKRIEINFNINEKIWDLIIIPDPNENLSIYKMILKINDLNNPNSSHIWNMSFESDIKWIQFMSKSTAWAYSSRMLDNGEFDIFKINEDQLDPTIKVISLWICIIPEVKTIQEFKALIKQNLIKKFSITIDKCFS